MTHLHHAGYLLALALVLGCGGVWLLSGHDRMRRNERKALGGRRTESTRKDHR